MGAVTRSAASTKPIAELAAQRVPHLDATSRFREELVGLERKGPPLLLHPALHLLERHLRMELDAPRVVAEPKRLRARRALRQLDPAGRDTMGVVVPLKRLECSR